MSILIPKTRKDLLANLTMGCALLLVGLILKDCTEASERQAQRDAEEERRQTPAAVQAVAEKDLKARGFTDINYESHVRKKRHSEMQYNAKKDGVTYLITSWCNSQKCEAPSKTPLRSERAEAQAAALWKQNGYDVVSYGRLWLSYDQKDSELEAVVSKDGKRYNGRTECEGDKCRVAKMAVTL